VKNGRHEAYGGDVMVAIAFKYGAKKAEEAFMCFNVTWSDDKGPQRVMGFAWPAAVKAMYNKELDVHFDGTFKMTPNGFRSRFAFLESGITAVVNICLCFIF
jgi:hypothetical protein